MYAIRDCCKSGLSSSFLTLDWSQMITHGTEQRAKDKIGISVCKIDEFVDLARYRLRFVGWNVRHVTYSRKPMQQDHAARGLYSPIMGFTLSRQFAASQEGEARMPWTVVQGK